MIDAIESSVRTMFDLVSAGELKTNSPLLRWSTRLLELIGELRIDLAECKQGGRRA